MATPQSQAMNADSLQAFDKAVVSGKYGYVDGILITRNGKLIYQKKYIATMFNLIIEMCNRI